MVDLIFGATRSRKRMEAKPGAIVSKAAGMERGDGKGRGSIPRPLAVDETVISTEPGSVDTERAGR